VADNGAQMQAFATPINTIGAKYFQTSVSGSMTAANVAWATANVKKPIAGMYRGCRRSTNLPIAGANAAVTIATGANTIAAIVGEKPRTACA